MCASRNQNLDLISGLASVSAADLDSLPANNAATNATAITTVADLGIHSFNSSPSTVFAGSNLTCTIIVTNRGPMSAASVTVANPLPPGVAYVNSSSSPGSSSLNGGVVTFNIGTLNSNAFATLTLVTKPYAAGVITNTATVSSPAVDIVPANNSLSSSATVTPNGDLAIAMLGTPNPAATFNNIVYTLNVTNRGPSAATNVVVTNTLPLNTTLQSVVLSQGTFTPAGGLVTCNLGNLSSNATASIAITVTANIAGTITNRATISSSIADLSVANNTAQITTTVTNNTSVGPLLRISRSGNNVVLYWSTNTAGYSLQSTPTLTNSAVWATVTNTPVIIGTDYYVTNAASGTSRHYRLNKPGALATGPVLNLQRSGGNMVLFWTNTAIGYTLQRATNLLGSIIWTAVTNSPVNAGGQFFVTNALSPGSSYYRLLK